MRCSRGVTCTESGGKIRAGKAGKENRGDRVSRSDGGGKKRPETRGEIFLTSFLASPPSHLSLSPSLPLPLLPSFVIPGCLKAVSVCLFVCLSPVEEGEEGRKKGKKVGREERKYEGSFLP